MDTLRRLDSVPDLPNFLPMMEGIARDHAPRLSFLDTQWRSLEAWQREARPFLRDRLGYSPKAVPLAAELVRREDRGDFSVEVVNISATPTYQIPARVLVPKGRTGKLPAVLAFHCHSRRFVWAHEKIISAPNESPDLTTFRNGTYGRPWAEALVRRGYVVIVIDAFYFGERRLQVEALDPARVFPEVREAFEISRQALHGSAQWMAATDTVCAFYQNLIAKTLFTAGTTWPGLLAWDDMRTVDYLLSRSDVDPGRIGCIGLSGGGYRSAMLAAADPRLKAACVTGWMTALAHQLPKHVWHSWMVFVPGLYAGLDLPDAAALHAPGALLVQQCARDDLFSLAGMRAAIEKLENIYAKAGIPERFQGTFYDDTHSFRTPMQEEAFDWMDRWL